MTMYYIKGYDKQFVIDFLDKHFPKTKIQKVDLFGIPITIMEDSNLPPDVIEFWDSNTIPFRCLARIEGMRFDD